MNVSIRTVFWLLVLTACGCGPRVGQVSGVVTYQGKPLPGGTLTFRPADGAQNSVAYVLGNDGKYNVTLPIGDVLICVDNREFEPQQPTMMPDLSPLKLAPEAMKEVQASVQRSQRESADKSARYKKIPDKYYAVETSGLRISVKTGSQTENIELNE